LKSLSLLIKEAAPYRAAPDRLARQIRARAEERNAAAPRKAASGWWHWSGSAALVAATALVTWIAAPQLQRPPTELVAEEVISSHARATLTGRVADVASSERHTVKPWLSSKLDFSPPVTDLAAEGFPLVGGRLDYLDRRPVAVLVYQRRKHVIDLFVWPDSEERSLATSLALSSRGYQVVHWTDRGMTFWAISDLNAAELKTFGERFSAK
jgi:anti-sigma factor RsiW